MGLTARKMRRTTYGGSAHSLPMMFCPNFSEVLLKRLLVFVALVSALLIPNAAVPVATAGIAVPAATSGSPFALAARVETGLLFVVTDCPGGSYSGSGFLLGPQVMATARHVLQPEPGCSTTVTQQGSGEQAVVSNWDQWYSVRRSDAPITDFATARLSRPLYGYNFSLASREPGLSQRVIALGYPYAENLSVTQGSVAQVTTERGVPTLALHLLSDHGGSGGPILGLNGRVLGLTQRGSRAGEILLSLDLAAFTGGRPSMLCTGVTKGCPSTVCGTAWAGPSGSSSSTYYGRSFSIRYPGGWRITTAEHNYGSYTDTSIVDPANPAWLLRIDEGRHRSPTPERAAQPVIKTLESERGYKQISRKRVLFDRSPALRWEFVVPEKGVLLHKVDIFVTADGHHDWAILFQAPATEWRYAGHRFSASVASLQVKE
jgi:Trypsin-like peptidase domain